MTTPTLDLNNLHLTKGSHSGPDDGMCLLEAVSVWVGASFGYRPPCVSPVLITFGYNLNDVLPDDRRQQLVPLVPKLGGTAGDGLDESRSYMALDWLIRTWTPAWLDLAGLGNAAAALRQLRRIVDMVAANEAGPVVRAARDQASAARAAAWAAAWDAARAAAWDAARAKLQPTVGELQTSAIALFEAMIRPAILDEPAR